MISTEHCLPAALACLALFAACGAPPATQPQPRLMSTTAMALGRPLGAALLASPAPAAPAAPAAKTEDGPERASLARDCAALMLTVETLHAVAVEGPQWQALAASPAWAEYEAAADRYQDCGRAVPPEDCASARAAVVDAWDTVAATPELAAARDTTLGRALTELMAHGEDIGCWEAEA